MNFPALPPASSSKPSLLPRHLHQLRHARVPRDADPGPASTRAPLKGAFETGESWDKAVDVMWNQPSKVKLMIGLYGFFRKFAGLLAEKNVDSTEFRHRIVKATDIELCGFKLGLPKNGHTKHKTKFMSVICGCGLFIGVA